MQPQSNIKLKLLSSGKYTWEIQIFVFDNHRLQEAVDYARQTDNYLRDKFPDVVIKGNSRSVELDE